MLRASLKISSLIIAMGLLSPAAQAGLMLEPYIGYSQGQAYDVQPSIDASYKTSNMVFGGRLGYTFPVLFWAALDYSLGTSGKAKRDIGGGEGDLSRSDLYATFGFDFPILLRAWVGYGLMNGSTITGSSDTKYSGGTNIKAGVGISVFPFVSMNLEAFSHKGQKYEWGGVSSTHEDFQDAGGTLSLSIPLDL